MSNFDRPEKEHNEKFLSLAEQIAKISLISKRFREKSKVLKNELIRKYLKEPGVVKITDNVGLGWFGVYDENEVFDTKSSLHKLRSYYLKHPNQNENALSSTMLNNLGVVILNSSTKHLWPDNSNSRVLRPMSDLLPDDVITLLNFEPNMYPSDIDLYSISPEELASQAADFIADRVPEDLDDDSFFEYVHRVLSLNFALIHKSISVMAEIYNYSRKEKVLMPNRIILQETSGAVFLAFDTFSKKLRYYFMDVDINIADFLLEELYKSFSKKPTIAELQRTVSTIKRFSESEEG